MNRVLTQEHKNKIRKTCLERKINQGSKNGQWKNGVTLKTYYCINSNCNNTVSYRAYRYGSGLCNPCCKLGRILTKETKVKIGKGNSGKKNGHYKNGIKNRKVYCIDCGKLLKNNYSKRCKSCSSKERLNRPEEKLKSRLRVLGNKNPMFGKLPKWGIVGSYKKTKCRSFYELNFARFLTCSHIKWKYESKTFDLGNTTYTPDFYLPEFDTYIEIKGIWIHDAKEKFNNFKKKYKDIKIKIFNQEELNRKGIML